MKSMELLIGMFAGVINKSTSTKEKLAPIPGHRWEVYGHDSEHRRRQILLNIAYCRDLQDGKVGKKVKRFHKRAYPRKKIFGIVYYGTPDKSFFGWVYNISEGGVFIGTGEPLSPRTDVTLAFTIPEGDISIKTNGKIKWTSKNGMGLKFKEVNESTKEKIKSVLSQT